MSFVTADFPGEGLLYLYGVGCICPSVGDNEGKIKQNFGAAELGLCRQM